MGEPLIYSLIAWLVEPSTPAGYVSLIGPMAFAVWIGFFVTMLNLLPIGQLDGGHIIYAMFGKIQHKIAYISLFLLIILSYWWLGWLFWGVLVFVLIRPKHPPTIMDELPLDKKRMAIGYLCIAVFILCFMPVPFSGF